MPLLEIHMIAGTTLEQKREISGVLTREVARIAKVGEERVKIYFMDIKPEDIVDGGKHQIDD